ncbi:hypothetical protein LEM8419_00785 [Neolewinella maritima]|uniref:CHAT domain-containing protein n=1 Tax=Neolewinella maritima TaxID=1383882 RepID=A0ABM9AXU4_9BACT|nr:CHAT domain-containing protein [Neolewinella maritima]CAH0999485.1 hypothetical protein LEM8419_00785 [Neolewinella maritima]
MNFVLLIWCVLISCCCWGQLTLLQQDSLVLDRLRGTQDLDARLSLLQDYLGSRPAGDTTNFLAEVMHKEVLALMDVGNYERVLDKLDRVIELRRRRFGNTHIVDYARSLHLKGALYGELEQNSAAAKWNASAIQELNRVEALKDPRRDRYYTSYLLHEATLNAYMGNLKRARLLLSIVRTRPENSKSDFVVSRVDKIAAAIELEAGNNLIALQILQHYLKQYDTPENKDKGIFGVYLNIGICYQRLNQPSQANLLFEKALAGHKRNCSTEFSAYACREEINTYVNLLNLATEQQQFERVDTLARLTIAKATAFYGRRSGATYAEIYLRIAEAASLNGRFQKAQDDFSKSLNLLSDGVPDKYGLPNIYHGIVLDRTVLIEWLIALRDHCERMGGTQNLIQALRVHTKLDSLVGHSEQALSATHSFGISTLDERELYEAGIRIAMQMYRVTGDEQYKEQARQIAAGTKSQVLYQQLNATELARQIGVPDELLEEKNRMQLRLSRLEAALIAAGTAERSALRDTVLQLSTTIRQLNQRLRTDYPKYASYIGTSTQIYAQVQASLDEHQLLLDYYVGDSHIHCFAAQKNADLRYYAVPLPDGLEELINQALIDTTAARRLYDVLLAQPLAAAGPQVDRLWIVPHDVLWNVSFQALRHDGHFLINDYAVGLAYSSQLLEADSRVEARAKVNPVLSYGISYNNAMVGSSRPLDKDDWRGPVLSELPYAVAEAKAAADILDGEARVNARATKTDFLRRRPPSKIYHFAMHGWYDELDPFRSALIFHNDQTGDALDRAFLTLGEIVGLDLTSRLAVLSACHTDRGVLQPDEGFNSLARGFALAGAEATIASRWAASDQVTSDIMGTFYRKIGKGEPLDRAMQYAVVDYLDNAPTEFRKPKYWANLTLTGAVDPLHDEEGEGPLLWLLLLAGGAGGGLGLYFVSKKLLS